MVLLEGFWGEGGVMVGGIDVKMDTLLVDIPATECVNSQWIKYY